MISKILIIASGGVLCYSKTFLGEVKVDPDLVSGFLTAISNVAQEIGGGEIRSLNFRNFNFIYSYDEEQYCMYIIITDIDDPEDEVRVKLELLKTEFINRYRKDLESWTGEITKFLEFDEFAEKNIFMPPKILIVGEDGVGKTTIMNLFPGETVLELDEDLNEIIQKSIEISGLKSINEVRLREIELNDLVNNSKLYRSLLDSVEIVCIVTNSGASNLGRTQKLYSTLKQKIKKADIYIIANFQDLKSVSFEPEKIEETFGKKTFGFSATQKEAKEEIYSIFSEMIRTSIVEKVEKKQRQ